jgi:hypothetical protein
MDRRTLQILACGLTAFATAIVVNCDAEDPKNQFVTSDDRLVNIAGNVPGFGGYYGDRETGELVIWLVDPDQLVLAESALVEEFGFDVIPEAGTRIRQAQYGFDQLKKWQNAIGIGGWTVHGIVSTDVADELNRVRIGVTSEAGRLAIIAEMDDDGIPIDAVVFRITRAAQPASAADSP